MKSKEVVLKVTLTFDGELNEFLKHNFFTRSGGGIGLTRLISSMLKEGLIE